MKAYHVVQWDVVHETAESRKYKTLAWYASPPKHDGLGFAHLSSQEDREVLYGTWKAILDVASRGPRGERGWLVRGARALGVEDLAAMTKFRVESFKRALDFFCRQEVGWLELAEFAPGKAGSYPDGAGKSASVPGDSPGKAGGSASVPGAGSCTDRQTVQTDKQTGTGSEEGGCANGRSAGGAGRADVVSKGAEGLKVQWAALNDQVKVLEGKKGREGLSGEERAELRQKKAARDEVQRKQAAGEFQ